MTQSEVYDAIKNWIVSHGYDVGYRIQKRFWNDEKKSDRYIVIQSTTGGTAEEAALRDYYRIIVISAQNDNGIDSVNDIADAIRGSMIDDYRTECIISLKPISGIQQYKTKEGRFAFEINFQTIVSR